MKQPSWQAQLLQTRAKAEVIAHIVGDVAAAQEGRLHDVDDEVQGPLETVGQDEHDELDVAVQQGDGAVAGELVGRLGRLGLQADDAMEELLKGSSLIIPLLVHVVGLEGGVEDEQEHGHERLLEGAVELVGQAVCPGAGAAAGLREGVLEVLLGQEPVVVEALSKVL